MIIGYIYHEYFWYLFYEYSQRRVMTFWNNSACPRHWLILYGVDIMPPERDIHYT